ncbi:hypothetical protein OF83DRAFT_142790 [Amylostereum chailletii]|nr:hypothetical protein OF83DRAFT_142790 [Amylostereum chailletii]
MFVVRVRGFFSVDNVLTSFQIVLSALVMFLAYVCSSTHNMGVSTFTVPVVLSTKRLRVPAPRIPFPCLVFVRPYDLRCTYFLTVMQHTYIADFGARRLRLSVAALVKILCEYALTIYGHWHFRRAATLDFLTATTLEVETALPFVLQGRFLATLRAPDAEASHK